MFIPSLRLLTNAMLLVSCGHGDGKSGIQKWFHQFNFTSQCYEFTTIISFFLYKLIGPNELTGKHFLAYQHPQNNGCLMNENGDTSVDIPFYPSTSTPVPYTQLTLPTILRGGLSVAGLPDEQKITITQCDHIRDK